MTRLPRHRALWFGAALLAALVLHRVYSPRPRYEPASSQASIESTELARRPMLSAAAALRTPVVAPVAAPRPVTIVAVPDGTRPRHREDRFPDRLRNTPERLGHLATNGQAVLLRNALVDTASGEALEIPARLHTTEPTGTYIVQAREAVDAALYARIRAEGGRVISYIPNNALLIEGSATVAEHLASAVEVGAVIPNQPYFKFEPGLLARVLRDAPLPPEIRVAVSVTSEAGIADIRNLGEDVEMVQRGPFGPLVYVRQPKDLVALARLPSVPLLEEAHRRELLNDRTAFLFGSVTNQENTGSLEGLTGAGLLVNLNDSGLDVTHPDLGPADRVLTTDVSYLRDPEGHGTHVAATIAGSGKQSRELVAPPQGSVVGADYRGKAPGAKLMILPIDLRTGPTISDAFLQETFARTNRVVSTVTNAPISNNSWGYVGAYEYTSISASYDIACRDALPEDSGEQPIMYVFSAGNNGGGASNGDGGYEDSVLSPGNAKNVITVGALESLRFLTNGILYDTNNVAVWANGPIPGRGYDPTNNTYKTNRPFAAQTDTDFEVATFSSRGNVGVGIEGDFGRFKPDVVAPGGFIFSARSQQWDLKDQFSFFTDPTTNEFYRVYDQLNQEGAGWYRYESGTSMSAPAISGLLAQMVEYFDIARGSRVPQRIPVAGYKAILINSALPTSETYNYNPHTTMNFAGWGLPNLGRAIGGGFSLGGNPVVGFNVGAPGSAGLATAQARSFRLKIKETQKNRPLSLTLAWTDPPGNPAATIKLVNNLDLIVSNTVTREFFVGNDFSAIDRFSQAHSVTDTNLPPARFDFINNVERVVIPGRAVNAELVVTIFARRVNVNAVASEPLNIVQDSALVLAAEGSFVTDDVGTVEEESGSGAFFSQPPLVTALTNGELRLNERVGANSPLLGTTNGTTNQWRFYSFTNLLVTNTSVGLTSGPNVAFVTFLPPDLARARAQQEADIDLYVSRDPRLLELNPAAINGAFKSVERGGTELVVFTNATVGPREVFYIGVKSEDQQGGEYSFIALSSQRPFGAVNDRGQLEFPGFAIKQPIPDGTPARPGYGLTMAIAVFGGEIRRVMVDESVTHGAYLDLVSTLNHRGQNSVLQNNRLLHARDGFLYSEGLFRAVTYDDSGSGDDNGAFPSHGPGSLNNYSGGQLGGVWLQQAIDNRSGNEGRIDTFTLRALTNDFGPNFVTRTVQPGLCQLEVINVGADVSRLRVVVTNMVPALPLQVLIQREGVPNPADPNSADKFATITPPGGTVTVGVRDVPPLRAGRYFIAVCNPNAVAVTYRIAGFLDKDLDSSYNGIFTSQDDSNRPLPDEALTRSSIFVDDSRPVAAIEVGLRLPHERISDLYVHLVNPVGQRTLVFESRGLKNTNGFGSESLVANYTHVALTYDRSNGSARLFVNARPVSEDSFPGFDPATIGDFIFGRDLSGRLAPTDAAVRLDDFAMWRKALSPAELIDIYNRGFTGQAKTANALQAARYPFDGNGVDATGSGADALLSGLPKFEPGLFDRAVELGGTNGYALADNQPFTLVVTNVVVTNIVNGLPTLATNGVTNIVRRTPPLDVGRAGFTLEGWITAPSGNTNIVIAGWSDRTNYYAPALLVGFEAPFGQGPGSFSAALVDTNGSARFLASRAGVVSTNPTTKNYNYAVFTDNTNRNAPLIKFAPAPFNGTAVGPIGLVVSGFDGIAPKAYSRGESFEDWLVTSSTATVVASSNAFNGPQLLSLASSTVRRRFSTTPGQKYQFQFRTRASSGAGSGTLAWLLFNDDLDRVLAGTADWTTHVASFFAKETSVEFSFQSTVGTTQRGIEVDGVELTQITTEVSFAPEEALKPLLGGNAFGDWYLEVTDARGQAVGELVSWQLRLTFSPTNPPVVRLTNGVPYRGTNLGGPSYFYVDVPSEATVALNQLTTAGGPLRLLYNSTGLPDGLQPGDVTLLPFVTGTSIAQVNTRFPPILPRGQRYYLEVLNFNGGETNQFVIQVDMNVPITPLTNNVPLIRTNLAGGREDFYSFEVPTGAISATFEVLKPTGDVNLYVSKAPTLPRPLEHDYASENPGTADELVTVVTSSSPVPLSPGRWYLGVFNPQTNAASYTVVARFNSSSLVALTNEVPYGVSGAVGERFDYYYIDVGPDVISGRFELRGLTGNADLYVRREKSLPILTAFDYRSTNSDVQSEVILVTADDGAVPMQPGRWFVGVRVLSTTPIDYQVVASIAYPPADLVELFDGVPDVRSNSVAGSQSYRFGVFSPTAAVEFSLTDLDGPADLFVAKGTLPRFALRTFSTPRNGTNAELVRITTNDVPNLVGDWYLTVERGAGGATNWTVLAITSEDGSPPVTGLSVQLIPPTNPGDPFQLQWSVPVLGKSYQVETTTTLSSPAWVPFGAPILATQPVVSVALPNFGDPLRYYRVVTLP